MTRAALDPEIAAFLDRIERIRSDLPPSDHPTMQQVRQQAEYVRSRLRSAPPHPTIRVEEYVLPGISPALRIRVYIPPGPAGGMLAYLHGGGWALFSLDTHDALMREYAWRSGGIVVGLDYALAPEHVFPVALEQIVEALKMLRGSEIFPEQAGLPLCVGGDSAGGNLALCAALSLRDQGETGCVSGLLLTYGVFDSVFGRSSFDLYDGSDYMLTKQEMETFWAVYCPDEAMRTSPQVAPLRAALQGLPSVSMTIATHDVLVDENMLMVEQLRQAGVDVVWTVYPGTTHSFIEAFDMAEVAQRAVLDQSRWLRLIWSGRTDGLA
ncbi:acetylesterase [Gluconacetobacter liquefaciens]|uniref:Acetyl esterase n=1 Tax=Gluconacetobacter liquefaciens TaxID=89584 RepID=A0A370G020_GLULI|nr:alpha/beta hydrolase [Gluconacetobacter liquefaciens]MBB2187383.1 alpha/beta hydrolase [Gluconacetobacter liquefaciens]RDI36346.1 acetyl esterase [Gluconacetobacter liquefaciens]GBQ96024.1 esterase/lipase [Gluconacetobacter liquefaciens NRIC 0522]GEB37900.1 acetylesterase [Gluconacetobacter liquefaciens]